MGASQILSGIKIEGKLTGTSDVKVEGEICGEVDLDSSIYIAQGGKVEAEVKAQNVFIAGEFKGNINATEFIQISPNGTVHGELTAPAISIERGAKFSGKIEMKESSGDASTPVEDTAPLEEDAKASNDDVALSHPTPSHDESENETANPQTDTLDEEATDETLTEEIESDKTGEEDETEDENKVQKKTTDDDEISDVETSLDPEQLAPENIEV